MDYSKKLVFLGLLLSVLSSLVKSASFQQIQEKLTERSQLGIPPDDIVISDVKKWVSDTVDQLSNQVEFIGNEIEKAVFRHTVMEHNQFLSDEGRFQTAELQRETPAYDVVCESPDGYEARRYREALWLITFGDPGQEYHAARLRCQSKIQRYILGENERGVKLHITSPWLSGVSIDGDKIQYSFLFYLPSNYQDDPPPPADPTIFFTYMSPVVFAFSLGSVPIGSDAGMEHHQELSSLLAANLDQYNEKQYYLADYEAPFWRNSLNNEMLIPVNALFSPQCGVTPPPEPESDESSCPDCSDGGSGDELEDLFSAHLEVRPSDKYLRKVTNICSFDETDMVIMDLFLYCQRVLPVDTLTLVSGDILLRVSGEPREGEDRCNAVSVEVFLRLPDVGGNLFPVGEQEQNISVIALDSMLVYTANVSSDGKEGSESFFEEVLPAYSKLKDRLMRDNICFEEHDFYLSGNLKSYPAMNRVLIPYSHDCWRSLNQVEEKDNYLPESTEIDDGSGYDDVIIDTFI